MTTLQSVWQILTAPYITSETETQREYMTRVVMGMILILVLTASIPVIIGWSILQFEPRTTSIVLVLDILVVTLWLLSYRGYWRLSSYFPPFLFFFLGAYGTFENGMLTGTLLFYVIAILLAFMLHGDRAQWFTLIIATITFLILGWWHDADNLTSADKMTISISVTASFGGVALLSWFSTRELHRSLRQIRTYAKELQQVRDHLLVMNASLQNEILERKRTAEAYLLSKQHYQLLFQTMLNGFALLDIREDVYNQHTEYLIREVNPAFERITGLRGDDIIGMPVHEIIPELEPDWIELSSQAANVEVPLELSICIKRLGKHFEIYAYSPEPNQVALLFLDITERIQRQKEMEAILDVATTLRSAQTPNDMIPLVLSIFTKLFQADGMAIGLRDIQSGEISFRTTNAIAETVLNLRRESGEMMREFLLKKGEAYISNDLSYELKLSSNALLKSLGIAAIPLIAKEEPIGILVACRVRDFSDGDIRLMLALADMVANAIQRATLNEETQIRLRQLDTLHNIEIALTSHSDFNLALEIVIEQILSRLDIDAADLLFYEPAITTLTYVTGTGFREDTLYHTALRIGKGFAGQVAMEQKIVRIEDLEQYPCDPKTREWIRQEGFITYCGIPLIAKGQVNGVLELYRRSATIHTEEWLAYLDTLARQVAIAIDNAWLLQDLQKSNLELRLAYDTTLEGWAKALELRDEETEGHSKNVTHLTLELAKRLNIPEEQWINIRRGALLHDIGKMGIPDHILFKPGPLSEEEWKIMRLHPIYAYELLSPITFLRPALEIPYCHHERWDGSGYPRKLKGEEIPLAARIFAVVDVWDALRSNRPYRAAWPEQTVRNYLKEQAGIQFDPRVVEEFLMLLEGR